MHARHPVQIENSIEPSESNGIFEFVDFLKLLIPAGRLCDVCQHNFFLRSNRDVLEVSKLDFIYPSQSFQMLINSPKRFPIWLFLE